MLQQEKRFRRFTGRAFGLRAITRYSLYDVFFYRTNVWQHTRRVAWLVQAMAPHIHEVYQDFNEDLAVMLALVHDDIELIIGDVQAGNKAIMTLDQRQVLQASEEQARVTLCNRFPVRVGKYEYAWLLETASNCTTLEAQVVKYLDKIDAWCEAMHELCAGNTCVTVRVTNAYGETPLPFEYYPAVLARHRADYYNLLEPLFEKKQGLFKPLPAIKYLKIVENGQPHTLDSLYADVGEPIYDLWKRIMLCCGDAADRRLLYDQIEFPV